MFRIERHPYNVENLDKFIKIKSRNKMDRRPLANNIIHLPKITELTLWLIYTVV